MLKRSLILMFVVAFAFGCQKDEGYTPGDFSSFSLSDAKGLFITEIDNKLYKITNSGAVEEVIIIDVGGNELTKPVKNLINLDDGNVILVYGTDDAYFVRLNSGEAFGFSQHTPKDRIYEFIQGYSGEMVSKVGNSSYIYVSNAYDGAKLVKLNASNPSSISFEVLSDEAIRSFIADIYGNVAYSSFNDILEFRSTNGEFETLPGETNYSTEFWTSMNDDSLFYYNTSLIDNVNKITGLRKIIPSPYEVVNYGTENILSSCGLANVLKIKNKNRVVTVGQCVGVSYLYSPDKESRYVQYDGVDLPISEVNLAYCSDNYYYVAGLDQTDKPMMLKVNPDDDSYTQLINGEYEITKMDVSANDEVLFSGVRLSDNKIVIGEISTSGTVTILNEDMANKALVFEVL